MGLGMILPIGVMTDIAQYEYMPDATPINTGIDRTVDWHEFVVRCHANDLAQPWLGGSRQFLIDGIVMPITTSDYANIFLLTSSNGGENPATGKSYWDTVFITKYINPEPAHGVWGLEETGEFGHPVYEVEEVVGTSLISPSISDDIILSLARIKTLTTEDPINLLSLSSHIPILSEELLVYLLSRIKTLTTEDPINLLSLSSHIPILSEDTMFLLLTSRIFRAVKEFITSEAIYPVIGGGHIVQAKGEEE